MNESCNERRVALIASLIAIPAAILIAMLVHHFIPVPNDLPKIAPAPASRPAMGGGGGFAPPPAAMSVEMEDLTPVYEKRVQLAGQIWEYAVQQQKAGELQDAEMIPLEVNCRIAEGAQYRFLNKIRTRGVSISDVAVKYNGAYRLVEGLKKRYEAGEISLVTVAEKTDAMLELEIQLKGNRNFNNEKWQEAYKGYCEAPGAETYIKMLEAEPVRMPFGR